MPLPPIARKRVCPRCGSKEVHRERRRGLYVRLVCLVWGVRPFRCSSCDLLFLAPHRSKT
jgi:rubredoxin